MAQKGIHSRVAVSEIARIMGISYEEAAQFCSAVRRYAKAKRTTDGQIYKSILGRKADWKPEAVARYTDGHAERIRRRVGHSGSNAAKQSRRLYKKQYYIYRNSRYQATVHFGDCSFCNYGRGANTKITHGWYGPYESRSTAMSEARKLSESVHLCEHCGGTLAIEHLFPERED